MVRNTENVTVLCGRCGSENALLARQLNTTHRCRTCKCRLCPFNEPVWVDELSFSRIVHSAEVPVLAAFLDNRFRACRTCAPDLYQIGRQFAGTVIVIKVDVNLCPEVAIRFSCGTVPRFLIFDQGSVLFEHSGAVPKADIERWLQTTVPTCLEPVHRTNPVYDTVVRFFSNLRSWLRFGASQLDMSGSVEAGRNIEWKGVRHLPLHDPGCVGEDDQADCSRLQRRMLPPCSDCGASRNLSTVL